MRHITTYTVGRKVKNLLAQAVFDKLIYELNNAAQNREYKTIDDWQTMFDMQHASSQRACPKCRPLYWSRWGGQHGKQYLSLYHNEREPITASYFLCICVTPEAEYYQPQFNAITNRNKLQEHLFQYAKETWQTWRIGENPNDTSPYFIPPKYAALCLEAELEKIQHQYPRIAQHSIRQFGNRVSLVSKTGIGTVIWFDCVPNWGGEPAQ